ncbi:MAG: MOSC N-terminal beta barrel domain-containing protein, partial [Polaromonas sp.]|nr:MOSC N-terminal beta barrel domain-containing protein [Polaromonas sp.]
MSGQTPSDISAVISRLYVYPVKSCAGVQVQDVILTETGLEFDRAWMVVDAKGHLGAIAAQWFTDFLGQPARLVRFDPEHKRVCSPQWTGGVEALNQFSDGYPLLVISEASLANFNEKLVAAGFAAVGMERFRPNIVLGDAPGADGLTPHDEDRIDLLQIETGQGAVQLKPVKPCPRCPIPNIDPATATSSPEVGDMLQT